MWYVKQHHPLGGVAATVPTTAAAATAAPSSASIDCGGIGGTHNHFVENHCDHQTTAAAAQQIPESPPSPVNKHHQQQPAKMVNRLKSLVSKKKKRFQADGFDLDLSYISTRIIAMGFPAERIEGFYRNHIDEVSRFFEQKHKGHYKIYHLCNERDFDACRFSGPVVRYPFSDHNAPQFEQILSLCDDVIDFLNQDPENIVAINCKAGKGRTGVMVCACLIGLQEAQNADDALRIYAERRTLNGQGVTIPSQRRYVHYYSRLHNSDRSYEPTPLRLTSIRIENLPHQLHGVQSFELSLSVYEKRSSPPAVTAQMPPSDELGPSFPHNHQLQPLDETDSSSPPIKCQLVVVTYQIPCSSHHLEGENYLLRLDEPVTVLGDFRIKIKARGGVLAKKIGQAWLNTFFVIEEENHSAPPPPPNTFDSNSNSTGGSSGSTSGSESTESTASSVASSRNSPPHFVGDEECPAEVGESNAVEGWQTHPASNTMLLTLPESPGCQGRAECTTTRRSSNPFRFGLSKSGGTTIVAGSSKRETGSSANITKKSPSGNFLIPAGLPNQLATPLAVHTAELSQSELDAAFKGRGKKGEEFRVSFEFVREIPCCSSASFGSFFGRSSTSALNHYQLSATASMDHLHAVETDVDDDDCGDAEHAMVRPFCSSSTSAAVAVNSTNNFNNPDAQAPLPAPSPHSQLPTPGIHTVI